MKIIKYSLGQLQANCYFVIRGSDCLIIDPGDEASFIMEKIQSLKLNPLAILATHGHFDHIGAVGEIQLSFNVPLYIFKEDQFLIDRLGETAKHFLGFDPHFITPKNISYLKIGNSLEIKNWKLKILFTPGHTPGGCCYYLPDEASAKEGFKGILFTGDTLFKDGIGRYDFSYSSRDDLQNSLLSLSKLPGNMKVFSGHGEETTIGAEKKSILQCFKTL